MAHPTETAVSSATAVSSTTTEYNYNWCESAMSASETSTYDPKAIRHQALCKKLNDMYIKKNNDYGDSFHQTFLEEGMSAARIRLSDKFRRFVTLSKGKFQMVKDESIRDTLMDLANYALMTILELEDAKDE